jgi:hypothetical protein
MRARFALRGLERAETDAPIGVGYRITNEQRSIGQSLSFCLDSASSGPDDLKEGAAISILGTDNNVM